MCMVQTTIRLEANTRDRLLSKAKKSETYDEYLNRLMDKEEEQTKWNQYMIQ